MVKSQAWPPLDPESNIVLIGMPGVGKSTVGVLLAKAVRASFIDTDVLLQASEGRTLPDIIAEEGRHHFLDLEGQLLASINVRGHVVATGGSAVYSDSAMRHLAETGLIVFLDLPLRELTARVSSLAARGTVIVPGMTLADLYYERQLLYERCAELTIPCAGKTQEDIVAEIRLHTGL